MSRPKVWISVDFTPPDRFRSCFDTAYETRMALRRTGYVANLFSVNEDVDFLRPGGGDVVFPIEETCRARPGDPFGLRRLLEGQGIPLVGSSHAVVERASDKILARRALQAAGFAVPGGIALHHADDLDAAASAFLRDHGCPAVLKPSRGSGGSVGVEYLVDESSLRWKISDFRVSNGPPHLLEEYVCGDEVTAWVIERDEGVFVNLLEIEKNGVPIFGRASKVGWALSTLENRDPGGTIEIHRPPRLPDAILRRVKETAIAVHRLFGASCYSRTDMIVRGGTPVVLELNTTPRLREDSLLGVLAGCDETFASLVAEFVVRALARAGQNPTAGTISADPPRG